MARPSKGPRLYLRQARADRERVWIIRDGPNERGTGCREGEQGKAERALAAYIANKHAPAQTPQAPSDLQSVLIADAMRVYLDEKAPLTKSSEWIGYMADPIISRLGHKTLAEINSSLCSSYVKERESKVSTATARHELKVLRAAVRYYHSSQFGPLPSVPVVTLPSKKRPRVDYFLTRSEVAQRIRAARRLTRMRHIPRLILIGWYSGSRPGTILKLRWVPSTSGGWFDLDNGVLHRLAIGEQESNKRQPPAKIHNRLLQHLRRWHKADAAKGITYAVHFYGKRIRKLRRSWSAAAIEAGHAKQIGVNSNGAPIWEIPDGAHVLRHSCVTWLLQDGVTPYEVSGYVGMDVETLQNVYGHHSPDFMRNAASAHGRRTSAPETPHKPASNSVRKRQAALLKLRK